MRRLLLLLPARRAHLACMPPAELPPRCAALQAVVYALKWPDPVPHVFGYHEVFHCFVTLAALLHFAAVYRVVNSPPLMRGTLSALSHSANSAALLTPHGSSP